MSARSEGPLGPSRGNRAWLSVVLTGLVVGIGFLDYWTGNEIELSILFVVPIALGAWFTGPRTSLALAGLSTLAWLVAELQGGFPYSNPAIPFWNAGVGLGFFLIIAAALSARKRNEQRILELMNIKSEFTSTVSHELRTPLTCIKEGVDIVLDGSCGALNASQSEHLRTAKRNVDRLARLLDDVLTFQKLEARRMELRVQPCDLNRLTEEVVEGYLLAAARKGLELDLVLASGLPLVPCDPDRMHQVLGNLLSNAIKFTERGKVRIRTQLVPEGVCIDIQDPGLGISAADLPRLFQGFTQVGSQRKEGTGLGLAIARRIVELHQGRIQVESSLGIGSVFSVVLPLGVEASGQAPATREARRASTVA